ncbi:hypothetical protein [Nonomuraea sp. NPDC049646]|uniref:hypothetical protein n=1 Tax=unclassified Nonomuraea TaxID=2593643 RepID=UPI00378C267A
MSTLIALYLGRALVGRCDANCYNGLDLRCTCVCGGANHGVGLAAAVAQTRQMVALWLDDRREDGWAFDDVEYGLAILHDALF